VVVLIFKGIIHKRVVDRLCDALPSHGVKPT
jgi:hypothetical protein